MNPTLGVIFDVDGVLVDSFNAHFRSYQLLGREYGLQMTAADFATYFGRTTRETIVELWSCKEFSADQIAIMDQEKETLYRQQLMMEFPSMDGAIELIDSLSTAGFKLAVGSSGPPENVATVLTQLCREDKFKVRVTGEDVTRGKPDPQVFEIAARRLNLTESACLVVEDAAAGVAAAKSANMAVIGLVSTGRTRDELAAADLVVDSLTELCPRIVQTLIEDESGFKAV